MHGLSYLKRAHWFPALFAVAVISSAAAPHNRLEQRGLRAFWLAQKWFIRAIQKA